MLMAHPAALGNLAQRYETLLQALNARLTATERQSRP